MVFATHCAFPLDRCCDKRNVLDVNKAALYRTNLGELHMTFTANFGHYADTGDSITCEVDGFTVTATLEYDDRCDSPDQNDEGFWPSLDPDSPGYIGPKSQRTLARRMAKAQAVMDAWNNDK